MVEGRGEKREGGASSSQRERDKREGRREWRMYLHYIIEVNANGREIAAKTEIIQGIELLTGAATKNGRE